MKCLKMIYMLLYYSKKYAVFETNASSIMKMELFSTFKNFVIIYSSYQTDLNINK